MVVYIYKGLYKNKIISGSIWDVDFQSALSTLNHISVRPISLYKSLLWFKLSKEDYYTWIEHLITLLSSGFHIKEAINITSDNSILSQQIALFTNQNKSFTEAIRYNKHLLPRNFVHIIEIMIRFTSIEEALKFFMEFHNTTVKNIKKEISTLYWPITQLVITAAVVLLISCVGRVALKPVAEELEINLPYFFHIFDRINALHIIFIFIIIWALAAAKFWKKIKFIKELYMHLNCYASFSFIGYAMQKGVPIKEAVLMSMNIFLEEDNIIPSVYRHLIRGNNIYESFYHAKVIKSQCEVIKITEKAGCIEKGFHMSSKISAYQIRTKISTIVGFTRSLSLYIICLMVFYVFFEGFLAMNTNILEKF